MKLTNKLFLPGILLLAFAFTLINSGCKKISDVNPTPQTDPDPDATVYVLGNTPSGSNATTISQAVVWKSGVASQLPSLQGLPATFGSAITVSGSDVYVVGSSGTEGNSTPSVPVYWKNGAITRLNVNSSYNASAAGIAVSGNDVYIGGTVGNNHVGNAGDAGYWKNGVFTSLADSANYYNSGAWNIAVSGTDVYVCGEIDLPNFGGEKAVYWKNGVLHELTDHSDFAWATKIYVQNNDVYVVYDQIKPGTTIMQAHYSKNDVDVQLPTDLDGSYVTDLLINGNDAYIAGYTAHPVSTSVGHVEAVLWKNNVAQTLFDGGATEGAYAYTVTMAGNNVYVSGQAGQDSGYWKNGVFAKVTSSPNYVNAIAVVAKSATP